jgi:hypothetical protein
MHYYEGSLVRLPRKSFVQVAASRPLPGGRSSLINNHFAGSKYSDCVKACNPRQSDKAPVVRLINGSSYSLLCILR